MINQHLFNKVSCDALDLIMMTTKILGAVADSKMLVENGVAMSWSVETDKEYHDNEKIGQWFPAVWIEQDEQGHTQLQIITDFVEDGSEVHKNLLILGGWAMERLSSSSVTVHYGFKYTNEDDTENAAEDSQEG